ncbi:DIP1984 family protein [Kingella negevensis]|uniref:Septicolysin n=1 Tax=Kingella negevensis TaxID=1522312 RepID=A0A238TDB9_9NEIS|nr:DIP1984 family protein [Kingella negevensis]MDK4680390.1 DIP1984 family protein [Kingella negevensis]MDK4681888.1 DIP1984 family protein [Kingella negevensis]MDK4685288.1 DIP1984 family protein [Kingella negevensis]MDK4690085.1 DIP1984 family protein [Kingella negevensis]MDK4692569.1 DIP1984 family protein [Kingella negevensis]
MKLAQALIERADLQRKLAQLSQRLQQNAQYQDGEMPSENPVELLAEYRQAADDLENLVVQTNLRNSQITLPNGTTMTAALAQRDRLKAEHATLIKLADAATPEQNRYSRSEIKMLSAVNVRDIRQQADQIAKRCRELDMQIQESNWLNDL